jgi:succinoglycan biosynthesis transport protein ExoP
LIRQVMSREYLKQLIGRLNLDQNPKLWEKAGEIRVKDPDLQIEEIVTRMLTESLKKAITVRTIGGDILEIKAKSNTPEGAYLMAKTLSEIFIQETLKGELGGVREALNFSKEQLEIYQVKLKESEDRLRRFKEKMLESQIQNYSITSANLAQINSMISSTDIELREAEDHLNSLKSKLNQEELFSLGHHSSPELLKFEDELKKAIDQLPGLLGRYAWMDAKVMKLNQLIGDIREKIKQQIEAESSSPLFIEAKRIKVDIEFLKRKRENLADFVEEYTKSLTRGPAQELTLSKLQNEVDSNRRLYNMFLEQSQGSQIEESLKRAEAEYRFKILEPATKPLRPVKPNRKKLLFLGFILGSAAGFGLVFFSEYMDHSFTKVEEVEALLGIPVLGTIPWMKMPHRLKPKEKLIGLKVFTILVLLSIFFYLTFFSGTE